MTDLQAVRSTPRRLASARRAVTGAALALAFTWTTVSVSAPMPESFSGLAEKVIPAVVMVTSTIRSESGRAQDSADMPFNFPKGSPFDEMFRQFRERQRPDRSPAEGVSLGSGFIIDPAGYVVTSNHVVAEGRDILIKLSDQREYRATLVGADEQTDLALLKLETKDKLPYVEFGDSDQLKVGDWVMAVGNPFGLGGTVTVGVLSARGRDIRSGPYDDFLQIDASINQGNSGGPTFNTQGKVIGVNTAIASPSGGNVGIGFAIPSNQAKQILAALRQNGHVERGWLGVSIQSVSPEIARAMGLDKANGALVAQVVPGGPAAKADIKVGDIITGFAGETVKDVRDLPRIVASTAAGTAANVELWRDGGRRTASVHIAKQPAPDKQASAQRSDRGNDEPEGQSSKRLGAKLATVTPELRRQFGIKDGLAGVVVLSAEQIDPRREHLRPGDLVQKVDGTAVSTPAEVDKAMEGSGARSRGAVLLQIVRKGQTTFVGVPLA